MFRSVVQAQKIFFASGKTKEYRWRKQALLKLKSAILTYEGEILDALEKDLGKHRVEGYMSEIFQVLHEINHALKLLKSYTRPKRVHTPITNFAGKSYIVYEPYGVCFIIAPWNYPFSLCISPLVGAIASGNCAMIKPSNYATHTQKIIAKIIQKTFSQDYICVIEGDSKVIEPIINERVDYVFFTGSVPVGKIIASHCAKHLIPSTLELGGKNPCIVDQSADLKMSAKKIMWGKILNAGQTCIAPDFLLVHHSIKDELLALLLQEIKNFLDENPIQKIGKTISPRHYERAIKLLDFESGLGKVYGGKGDGERIEPTIIDFGGIKGNPALSLEVLQEEIFAPILPILSFEEIKECLELIHTYEKPLALYLFSENRAVQEEILSCVSFGGGCINDCIMQIVNPHLPFGGVGHSGMGRYHGKFSIETFSHKKSIYHSFKFELPLRYPPYEKPLFGFISKIKFLKTFFT